MKRTSRAVALLSRPGLAVVRAARSECALTIVGWHRVDGAGSELATPVEDFRGHLDVLAERGAVVLPLAQAADLLARRALPPHAVALTFDDGYASIAELAWPLLLERGWPATLFAVSGYLDGDRRFPWDANAGPEESRLLDSAALRELAASGMDIGSHTVTHPWLPALAPGELDQELVASKQSLEDVLGQPVDCLAYPTGGWDRRVRTAAAAAGYSIGITVDRGDNRFGQDPLALRRAFAFSRRQDFGRQLDGAFDWMRPIESHRMHRRPSWS